MPPARNKQEGQELVARLVATFGQNRDYYRSTEYGESACRDQFTDRFFESLGWDVRDEAGLGPRREVIVELAHQEPHGVAGEDEWDDDLTEAEVAERAPRTQFPDYLFRVDGVNRFVAEAKKPSVDLRRKLPTFQAKSYAWSMRLPIAVLTDFEELRVFDARFRPAYDNADGGLVPGLDLKWNDYLGRWDELWDLLGRDAVAAGSLDRFASAATPRGAQPVDKAFLERLAGWRFEVATDLRIRNPDLDRWELSEATQRILDRLVIIRLMEDRGVLDQPILRRYARIADAYRRLVPDLRALDGVYNGQIFAAHFSERLELSDGVVQGIVENLYFPRSPYRFDVLSSDLLGNIYERFLGQTIEIMTTGQVAVQEKPEVRHAGGVYYTPRWIVDRIVATTLGPLVAGKTPRAVGNLRVVDPACGSGAFLLGAFSFLVAWHEHYYAEHPTENPDDHYTTASGAKRLTSDAKAKILADNLFGVDIDPQAVEVTQMSLYMAMLEGETFRSLRAQRRLFESAFLPRLDMNIRCGNSLLSAADIDRGLLFAAEDTRRRVNPFDWNDERLGFGEIVARRGGFDAVIGNPPYTRVQVLRRFRPEETQAYQSKYRSAATGSFDIASTFIEKGLDLLRQDGRLGFIVSRQFAETDSGLPLRQLLAEGAHVSEIVDFADGRVFAEASAYTMLLFLTKRRAPRWRLTRVSPPPTRVSLAAAAAAGSSSTADLAADVLRRPEWPLELPAETTLLERLRGEHTSLKDVCRDVVFQGVVTGADYVFRLLDRGPDPNDPRLRRVARRDNDVEASVERELLRPVLGGRSDIGRFVVHEAHELLLLPYRRGADGHRFQLMSSGDLSEGSPRAWAWLQQHEAELRGRNGNWTGENWWSYSRRQNLELFCEPKILLPYMIDHLCAFLDRGDHFLVNVSTGGYGIPVANVERPELLAALLNSRVLSWVLRRYSRAFRGGWFAARKGTLTRLPVLSVEPRAAQLVVDSYQGCIDAAAGVRGARADHERTLAERTYQIAVSRFDDLVEGLYRLNDAERRLISVGAGDPSGPHDVDDAIGVE